jgi:hypothetical protein
MHSIFDSTFIIDKYMWFARVIRSTADKTRHSRVTQYTHIGYVTDNYIKVTHVQNIERTAGFFEKKKKPGVEGYLDVEFELKKCFCQPQKEKEHPVFLIFRFGLETKRIPQ